MERDKMNRRLSVAGVYKCLCACLLPSSFSFASDVHWFPRLASFIQFKPSTWRWPFVMYACLRMRVRASVHVCGYVGGGDTDSQYSGAGDPQAHQGQNSEKFSNSLLRYASLSNAGYHTTTHTATHCNTTRCSVMPHSPSQSTLTAVRFAHDTQWLFVWCEACVSHLDMTYSYVVRFICMWHSYETFIVTDTSCAVPYCATPHANIHTHYCIFAITGEGGASVGSDNECSLRWPWMLAALTMNARCADNECSL